jgi:hypothetical protein
LEVFGNISKYSGAEGFKKAIFARGVTSIKVNHVRYKKVTDDDEVIARDTLKELTPQMMAAEDEAKTRKMFMDTLLESVLTEEFAKTLNIETLMANPGAVSSNMIQADLESVAGKGPGAGPGGRDAGDGKGASGAGTGDGGGSGGPAGPVEPVRDQAEDPEKVAARRLVLEMNLKPVWALAEPVQDLEGPEKAAVQDHVQGEAKPTRASDWAGQEPAAMAACCFSSWM